MSQETEQVSTPGMETPIEQASNQDQPSVPQTEMQVEQEQTGIVTAPTDKQENQDTITEPTERQDMALEPQTSISLLAGSTSSQVGGSTPSVIPQDLEMIMNMVTNGHELAGLSMEQTGAEMQVVSESDDGAEQDSSDDSDSDSDSESSSTMSSIRGPPAGRTTNTPMSAEMRDRLMAQLTTFYGDDRPGAGDEGLNEDGEGYITADSDELEEEVAVDVGLGWASDSVDDDEEVGKTAKVQPIDDVDDDKDEDASDSESSSSEDGEPINLMDMEDESEDEGGAAGPSEPPKTKHEVEDDRAVIPDVDMLPQGERLVLAGEIMSVMLNARPVEVKTEQEDDVKVKVEVKSEVLPKTEEIIQEQQEIKPVPVDADTISSESNDTTTATKPTVKPRPAPKNAKTKQREKREQKQLAKSSGTIIIKALRAPLGEAGIGGLRIGDDEGWLEEGSLICLENRRVLAVVAETFGPLSQPFYLLRLPTAPYPLPGASELTVGTHVYYPASGNRSFVPVRMLKTDKRYKGTDASNLHDEEVSESEREWSDDEAEREAKRQRKAGKGKAAAPKQRHWDAGAEVDFDDDSEFLDYAQAPEARDDDDGRSMAGMSTVSTRGGRTGPVRYDDIVPSGSIDQPKGAGSSGRGAARGGATRGRGRGGAGAGEARSRFGERDGQQQRGRGRGDGSAGGRGRAERGSGRGGAGRNQDGGRQIGQGSGRGRGRGQAGFGSPGSSRPRDMSPTSMAIARATGQAPVLSQGTGIAQPMSAPMPSQQAHYGHVNPMMHTQQPQQPQQQAMMGMQYGWQGQPGQGMGMPQMPFFYNPMQQGQQAFGGQYQQGANQGAFNPAFAARMMGMGMGMGGMPFQQPAQQQPPQNNPGGGEGGGQQNPGQQ